MTSWHDPEIAGVRALLAARAPEPGAPPPTYEQRRAMMNAFGEMGSLPAGCLHEPMMAGTVRCERVVPQGARPGRTIQTANQLAISISALQKSMSLLNIPQKIE